MKTGVSLKPFRDLISNRWLFLCLIFLAFPKHIQAGQCGTALLFDQGRKQPRVSFKSGNLNRISAIDTRARTLETEHFLIHYSLHGLYKVRTGPEDVVLTQASDSLYSLLAALPEAKRDSAVYARLDVAGAPHPAYILKVREYFEAAWNSYVVNLGMKAPASTIASTYYKVSRLLPKKFPVDIVDLGTANRLYSGEIYAVTNPPESLSITFENDFLWYTNLDSSGRIVGRSIKSQVSGTVIHDYAVEWELGVKVTAYHEFYHAIQFTYNPGVTDYHAWYEISAVGMEERNAPEVNDYFQYLPCILNNHERVALTTLSAGPCTHSPVYGNGIFHVFLSQTLDKYFDVKVWEELASNKDDLPKGLENTFLKYGKTMTELYPDYATQLLFSGRRFHPPVSLFSSDIPLWTNLATDSLDMSKTMAYRLLELPPLTFMVLKVTWDNASVIKVLQTKGLSGLKGITRIHTNSDSTVVEQILDAQITLGPPRPGFKEYYLVLPNASFTDSALVEIKTPEPAFYAFPNPVHFTMPASLYFSQGKGMIFPATIDVFSEDGRLVRKLKFATSYTILTWDLRDENSKVVKPGIYYYRLENEKLRPLVVLR